MLRKLIVFGMHSLKREVGVQAREKSVRLLKLLTCGKHANRELCGPKCEGPNSHMGTCRRRYRVWPPE